VRERILRERERDCLNRREREREIQGEKKREKGAVAPL